MSVRFCYFINLASLSSLRQIGNLRRCLAIEIHALPSHVSDGGFAIIADGGRTSPVVPGFMSLFSVVLAFQNPLDARRGWA